MATKRVARTTKKKGPAAETGKEFLQFLRSWQRADRKAIAKAEKLSARTDNPLISMIMGMIAHDSRRRELIQQMLINSLTRQAVHISPDELNMLAKSLDEHIEMHEAFYQGAQDAFARSELVATRFFLSQLMADEERYHDLARQLDELRQASIPTSASARR